MKKLSEIDAVKKFISEKEISRHYKIDNEDKSISKVNYFLVDFYIPTKNTIIEFDGETNIIHLTTIITKPIKSL